tara:strand:- start:6954 stop:7913 length:960 start_codon:yes stop_codon:yes gene_type:complete
MAIRKGLPAKLALTDADDTRYLFSGLVVCNVDGSPRGGVLSPVGTSLVTATATMNVSVARFQGVAVRDGGVVLLANDGAVNVLLDAAPGANSRIDVIYAKQNDSSATVAVPDANNTPVLGFVKGTAGAIPVKPSLPAGALELATVEIPSGATATNSGGVVITQTAPFTAGAGGTVPFRTKTAMDLWTTAQSSQSAIVLADRSVWYSSAGVWSSLDDAGAWIYPTLTNGTNQAGNSFGYRRLVNSGVKVVYLRGRVTGVSSGQTMVTLPVGYRPDAGDDNVLILDQNTQRVNVKSDGTIVALSTWGINSASFLGVNFIAV